MLEPLKGALDYMTIYILTLIHKTFYLDSIDDYV